MKLGSITIIGLECHRIEGHHCGGCDEVKRWKRRVDEQLEQTHIVKESKQIVSLANAHYFHMERCIILALTDKTLTLSYTFPFSTLWHVTWTALYCVLRQMPITVTTKWLLAMVNGEWLVVAGEWLWCMALERSICWVF